MKKVIALFIILSAFVLSGCGPSQNEVPAVNREYLAASGEVVGTLPDGREVKRWGVWSASGNYWHTIYVVDGATSISDNYQRPAGKTTVPATEATIIVNGRTYVPKD